MTLTLLALAVAAALGVRGWRRLLAVGTPDPTDITPDSTLTGAGLSRPTVAETALRVAADASHLGHGHCHGHGYEHGHCHGDGTGYGHDGGHDGGGCGGGEGGP
ncbi:MAG: hypothetical protein HYZ53_10315 [Planctomycetes bacterium]|nr:hypothetical protein [Planctomycetota bacterium]